MHKSKIDFYHKEIGGCAKLKDFKNIGPLVYSLTGKNSESTTITEILVNDKWLSILSQSPKLLMNILLALAVG